ncbi:glycosyltransferase, MGT family [Paenibacillus sp. yr247]|uniref:nucleotide disphospho-sugar-binding domain-containing protein n=1 Tax=Paenibacillus sp. yr247 TaxID=1761880 RepID=UPI00088B769F|nr:nucleotide disphospho-sugar-binding domain-containing protein [Paenibacillus sp. yr247]SDP20778.1 glycosyltransferase, MGT family [Paenibacillus sp. yr247]
MTKVIIPVTSIYGHVSPMLSIAKDLIHRGHEVSIITGTIFKEAVEKTGAAFVPFLGSADLKPEDFNDPERLALQGLDQANYDTQRYFIGSMADQYTTLQRVLAKYSDDQAVVLSETLFAINGLAPALLGATGVRAKGFIVVGVVPLMFSSIDAAPFGMGLEPDSSEEGRARNIAHNALMKDTIFGETQKLYEKVLNDLGATEEIPFFFDTPARADSYLQLSVEELSYKRSDLPASVRFIGALPTPASVEAQLPEWWPDVLAANKVVVVTQGTVANTDFSHLIEPTLEALADLPVLVIAATGSKTEIKNVPANARVVEFVPFVDLLPHTSVLVTNGGFGGTQQALSFGVPMVLAGETEDKLEGNARTAHTGAAINLKTQKPTPAAIREAVENVLSDPSYLNNAQRVQAEYAALDPYTAIANTVAELDAK